ncbi:hypothetical protein CPY51_27435 [Rhizobium tubonense]|uniref:Uncharacterized protein n=1 Tax=Rhizobium tubonense TaxID=484088 RepID=A0A2W4C5Y8_9HYPH|nr:hypothetical protein CPY51_27435 [Rhizobium tubonense]
MNQPMEHITNDQAPRPNDSGPERSDIRFASKQSTTAVATMIVVAGLAVLAIGATSRLMWPRPVTDAHRTLSTIVPGTGAPAGAIDNGAPFGQPLQTAPTNRSENNERELNGTPQLPSRDGAQK